MARSLIEETAISYARATGTLIAACMCAEDDLFRAIESSNAVLDPYDRERLQRALRVIRKGRMKAEAILKAKEWLDA